VHVVLTGPDGAVVGWLEGLRYPVIDAPAAPDADAAQEAAVAFGDLGPEELRAALIDEIGTQIAGELRLAPEDLSPRRPLAEQGLDSVLTVAVRRRLERRFGRALPATLLWRQPTIAGIAEHLAGLLGANGAHHGR
jgi:acyl carrier protein